MTPRFLFKYSVNALKGHFVFCGKASYCLSFGLNAIENILRIFFAEFRTCIFATTKHKFWMLSENMIVPALQSLWMKLCPMISVILWWIYSKRMIVAPPKSFGVESTAVVIPTSRTPFFSHIPHAFGSGSKPQMRRVYAISNIARMADAKTQRDSTVCYYPRHTMGGICSIQKREISVSPWIISTNPQPTRISFVNLFPKSRNLFRSWIDEAVSFWNVLCRFIHNLSMSEFSNCRFCTGGDYVFSTTTATAINKI